MFTLSIPQNKRSNTVEDMAPFHFDATQQNIWVTFKIIK